MAVDVAKFGQGSEQSYVGSCCVFMVIDEQGESIGRLHKTIQSATKHINIMSNKMGGTGQDLHNMEKEMEYYAAKIHQVNQRFEVSNMFFLWHFWANQDYMLLFGSIRSLRFHT